MTATAPVPASCRPRLMQYYDIPALSLRSAVFPLLQAGVPGFKASPRPTGQRLSNALHVESPARVALRCILYRAASGVSGCHGLAWSRSTLCSGSRGP